MRYWRYNEGFWYGPFLSQEEAQGAGVVVIVEPNGKKSVD